MIQKKQNQKNQLIKLLIIPIIILVITTQTQALTYDILNEDVEQTEIEYITQYKNIQTMTNEEYIDFILNEEITYHNYQGREELYNHFIQRLQNPAFLEKFNKLETKELRQKFWEHQGIYKYEALNYEFLREANEYNKKITTQKFQPTKKYEFSDAQIQELNNNNIILKGYRNTNFNLEEFTHKGASIDSTNCLYLGTIKLCEIEFEITKPTTENEKTKLSINTNQEVNNLEINNEMINQFNNGLTINIDATQTKPLEIDMFYQEYQATGKITMTLETIQTNQHTYLINNLNIQTGKLHKKITQDQKYIEIGSEAEIYYELTNNCDNPHITNCLFFNEYLGSILLKTGKITTYTTNNKEKFTIKTQQNTQPILITDKFSFSQTPTHPNNPNHKPRIEYYSNEYDGTYHEFIAENFAGELTYNAKTTNPYYPEIIEFKELNGNTIITIKIYEDTKKIYEDQKIKIPKKLIQNALTINNYIENQGTLLLNNEETYTININNQNTPISNIITNENTIIYLKRNTNEQTNTEQIITNYEEYMTKQKQEIQKTKEIIRLTKQI